MFLFIFPLSKSLKRLLWGGRTLKTTLAPYFYSLTVNKNLLGEVKAGGRWHNEVRAAEGGGGNMIIMAQEKHWKILPLDLMARYYLCPC